MSILITFYIWRNWDTERVNSEHVTVRIWTQAAISGTQNPNSWMISSLRNTQKQISVAGRNSIGIPRVVAFHSSRTSCYPSQQHKLGSGSELCGGSVVVFQAGMEQNRIKAISRAVRAELSRSGPGGATHGGREVQIEVLYPTPHGCKASSALLLTVHQPGTPGANMTSRRNGWPSFMRGFCFFN